MRTKAQKWGNSIGIRIPSAFAREASLAPGTEVNLCCEDGTLVITPASRVLPLADLVAGITPRNLHGEIRTDGPRGREIW